MGVFLFDIFEAVGMYEGFRRIEDVQGNISGTGQVLTVNTFLETTFLEDSGVNRLREPLCRCPGNHRAKTGVRHIC